MTWFQKIASIPPRYWLWGIFLLLLGAQFLWDYFLAYPVAFERQLRRGKPWLYIPRKWKGPYRSLVLGVSRALLLALAGGGSALLVYYPQKKPAWMILSLAAILVWAASRLHGFWTHLRYRQQEDAYFRLHDQLRARLDQEGKDYTDFQFRNLAAYQHQQRLHKADEAGEFLTALRGEARLARRVRPALLPSEA